MFIASIYRFIKQERAAFVLLGFYALAAHLLLLFNDLPYWDAWYYTFEFEAGNKDFILKEWRDNGRVLIGQIYWWLGSNFGPVLGIKVVIVAAIVISSWLFYTLLLRHSPLSKKECLLVALLGSSYPAYQVHLAVTTFTYILALPFFFSGLLFLLALSNQGRALGMRFLAHICFLIAYISEAYVVAGLLLPALVWISSRPALSWRGLLSSYQRYSDFVVAAIFFMAAIWFLMPVQDGYAHTRNINFSPLMLIKHYVGYVFSALDLNILNLTSRKLHRDALIGLWAAIAVAGFFIWRRSPDKKMLAHYTIFLAVALLLLGAIGAPFVLAQRMASTYGWEMRHLVPVGFLASSIMFCALGLLVRNEIWRHRIGIALVTLSFITLSKDYLIWQARGAFDRGVILHIKENDLLARARIVFVGNKQFYFRETYRPYEWAGPMRAAYGHGDHWVKLSEPPMTEELWNEWRKYFMDRRGKLPDYDQSACQVWFDPAPAKQSAQRWTAGAIYLLYSYGGESQKAIDHWLYSLAALEVTKVANCD